MQMFLSKKPVRFPVGALLLGLLLGSLLFIREAEAEVLFSPRTMLVEGDTAEPRLAVDARGRATITWMELGPDKRIWIQALRVSEDGVPGPIHTLAKFGRHYPECPCPDVAVGPAGRATIVWQGFDGNTHRIEAAQIDASGAVGPAHVLSPPGYEGWDQTLAVDSGGRPTIVWDLASTNDVEAVRFGYDGSPEEVHVLVAGASGLGFPAVGVGPDGTATVVWPDPEGLATVQLDPDGDPGQIRRIEPTGNADGVPHVVVDGQGRATVGWWRGLGAYEALITRLDPAGIAGPVHVLNVPGEGAFDPRLAVDPQERVTAVWQGWEDRVYSTQLNENGAPGTIHTLSRVDHPAGVPEVAVGPEGRAVVVWSHPPIIFAPDGGCLEGVDFDPKGDVVEAAVLGPTGEPEEIKAISPFGEQALIPEVAMDSLGQPTVVWETFDGTYFCEDATTRIHLSRGMWSPDPAPSAPEAPSTTSPFPQPESTGILRLGGKAVAKGERVFMRADCVSGTCAGALRLVARVADLPRRLERSISGVRKRSGERTVARAWFSLAGGTSKTLALQPSKFGRELLRQSPRRLLRLTGKGQGVQQRFVWVRFADRQRREPKGRDH
jgi:hypothetical protein